MTVVRDELLDPGSFAPVSDELVVRDPLAYPGYRDQIETAAASGPPESVLAGPAEIYGHPVEVALFEFDFLGGSMGEVAGERLARSLERGAARRAPVILFTATGGARMQEGMRSLVQMPKVVAARLTLAEAATPLVAVLGSPTTGGVLASIGSLADVTLAERGATIGFAGPRVVEGFTGAPLRHGSHTSESAFRAGLVDELVHTRRLRCRLVQILRTLARDDPQPAAEGSPAIDPAPSDPWAVVERVRDPRRPLAPQVAMDAAEVHVEIRGDRAGGDDAALRAWLARVAGRRVAVMALDRRTSPGPRAFRKARRLLEIAGRLQVPVVTLVDTPGADPSEDSEAGGIAWEIARLFQAMLEAPVPVLAIVTGEGGSGGALAFATADRLIALHDSIFSVIAPEGAARILWRDAGRAPEAARLLRLTAPDLVRHGIADEAVPVPLTGESIKNLVAYHLDRLTQEAPPREGRSAARRERWRDLGAATGQTSA